MNEQPQSSATTQVTLTADCVVARIDRWLAEQLTDRSRSEIQRWIREDRVTVNGALVKASEGLALGDRVVVDVPVAPEVASLVPEEIELVVVYEDGDLLVIDKPAGMVVHPAPGHARGTLVNAVLHRCPDIVGVGGQQRPGIVHRLDRETSGLILVAKNDRSHRFLQAQFQQRTIYKEYLALVEGHLEPSQGQVTAPIGRHPTHRQRQAVLPADPVTGLSPGREAITEYHVLAYYAGRSASGNALGRFSLLKAVLRTGRTHQIRVHMAWLKHPVVGDTTYGYRKPHVRIGRHFLHAHRLRVRLPASNAEREFVAPLPQDLRAVLDSMEESG